MIKETTCFICNNEDGGVCRSHGVDELFYVGTADKTKQGTSAAKYSCTRCGVYYIAFDGGDKLLEYGAISSTEVRLAVSNLVRSIQELENELVIVPKKFLELCNNGKKYKSVEDLFEEANNSINKN